MKHLNYGHNGPAAPAHIPVMYVPSSFYKEYSIDRPVSEDNQKYFKDILADINAQERITSNSERLELIGVLGKYLDLLDSREGYILRRRFGCFPPGDGRRGTPQKLQEIGNELGLSRERIRQLEAQGLEKLRQEMIKDHIRRELMLYL